MSSTPGTDRAAVTAIIRALKAADHKLVSVNDGEEDISVSNEKQVLDAVFSVDEATLFVTLPDGKTRGWVWFVLGNDPEEVAADYTVNLEPALGPLFESWWS